MMHPEDEANTDAPLVPDLRGTDRERTGTNRPPTTPGSRPTGRTDGSRPASQYPNEPDPLQPHLGAIRAHRARLVASPCLREGRR